MCVQAYGWPCAYLPWWNWPSLGHTIARDRTDMMDVAWGLCARPASAVASSTHQPTGRGREHCREGGMEGRDTNQTSHFPRSAHKYLCGWFINSGAREQIKGNCNAYIKLGLFHDTALDTMPMPIKDKAIYHEAYWQCRQDNWMATHVRDRSSPSCDCSSSTITSLKDTSQRQSKCDIAKPQPSLSPCKLPARSVAT